MYLQFVLFKTSYNSSPTVLVSANHSTTVSGNSAAIHNGISTWIEVTFCCRTQHHLAVVIILTKGQMVADCLREEKHQSLFILLFAMRESSSKI